VTKAAAIKPEDEERVRFHKTYKRGLWGLLTRPFWWPRYRREWDRRYPLSITDEQSRRLRDLGDPYGQYAHDDPRKYGIYDKGTAGYKPTSGQAPYRIRPHRRPTDNLGGYDFFSWTPDVSRDQFRRFVDLGDHRDEYDRDDPRRYGLYGKGTFGYIPMPGEPPSDGKVLRFWDPATEVERIVDTTRLTNEQYRRLLDLGDPHANYAEDDPRAYGFYECGTTGLNESYRKRHPLFVWRD
jgi:hypothetical protein